MHFYCEKLYLWRQKLILQTGAESTPLGAEDVNTRG